MFPALTKSTNTTPTDIPMTKLHIRQLTAFAGGILAASTALAQDGFVTTSKPYIVPTNGSPYVLRPILSVGDQVPETGSPLRRYQMIGIPDGMGAANNGNGTVDLYLNHEIAANRSAANPSTTGRTSEPFVGGPLQRGAFISKYILSDDGSVLSGDRAYDSVFDTERGLMLAGAGSRQRNSGVLTLLLRLARGRGGRIRSAGLLRGRRIERSGHVRRQRRPRDCDDR
jgi:hypothetical protein